VKSAGRKISWFKNRFLKTLKSESTTTRRAGGLDFTAKGGKRQGARSAPIVENTAVWKTHSMFLEDRQKNRYSFITCNGNCFNDLIACFLNAALDKFYK
jgi:hypothetical protein